MFYFMLALRLGMTVEELLCRVSSAELTEWLAFNKREPIGDWRHDVVAAQVCAVTVNRDRKRHQQVKVDKFIPQWGGPRQQSVEEQMMVITAITQAMGRKRG